MEADVLSQFRAGLYRALGAIYAETKLSDLTVEYVGPHALSLTATLLVTWVSPRGGTHEFDFDMEEIADMTGASGKQSMFKQLALRMGHVSEGNTPP